MRYLYSISLKQVVEMSSYKYGEWTRAGIALKFLSTEIAKRSEKQLMEDAKEIKDKLVGHIDSQDLGWKALSEDTIRQKGNSKIYVESGYLRDNLDVRRVKGDTVFIGASFGKKHPSGVQFSDLMNFHEYGTSSIPARPLIRPTWEEVEPQVRKNWEDMLKRIFREL